MRKTRKKGSAIIEFLVVIPVFILLVWGIMEVMMFTLSTSTLNQAAEEGARVLSENLRGYEGTIGSSDAALKTEITSTLKTKIENVTRYDSYILLFHDAQGNYIEPDIQVLASKTDCQTYLGKSSVDNAICTWSDNGNGADQSQVGVLIKAKFNVGGDVSQFSVDSVWSSIYNSFHLYGSGISHLELTNRFNYYQ